MTTAIDAPGVAPVVVTDEQVHAFLLDQYEPVPAKVIAAALGGTPQAIGHNLRRLGKRKLALSVGHETRANGNGIQALWVAA